MFESSFVRIAKFALHYFLGVEILVQLRTCQFRFNLFMQGTVCIRQGCRLHMQREILLFSQKQDSPVSEVLDSTVSVKEGP
jgi:hypothetical protein